MTTTRQNNNRTATISDTDRLIRRAFRITAITEAFTWVGMLISLAVKYPLQGSPLGVTIFGWIHGIVWIAFVVACLTAAIWFKWSWWIPIIGLLVSTLPFLTVPFEMWMQRTGRIISRKSTTQRTASTA